ncbi:MAG TPA: hypothetical protein VLF40_00735 [Candidatus Saccharimonadales bacterium]|nr:hypothetical protein [Candidatus Saccharimonadales bacterium]
MGKYISPLMWFGTFVFFTVVDYFLYYAGRDHRSWVPLVLGCLLTAGVGVLTVMALYETFIHRNDKESW